MTLKTSLFNKGIYKSTLKRYMWGAILYFIILFVTTALPILLAYDPHTVIGNRRPVLYHDGFSLVSILIAMVVPTVVGLLIFRFLHSKKTSIFMHSLPVGRSAIYTSSVVAGITLMCVPVVLNGIILAIMSFTDYGVFVTLASAVCWTMLNLLTLFAMFACTAFVSSITGNSFAMIALTILFHGIIPLVCATLGVFAETFLFGFTDITELLAKVARGNLVFRLINRASGLYTYYSFGIPVFGLGTLWEILAAAALFVIAWALYKNRNLETAEDVAGFKVLNPIFKYLVTFLAAICAFALFGTFISENTGIFATIVFIVSIVTYFAIEMVLKKTLKVWKSYKGYIAFAAAFLVMTSIFAFTSFFGYETRIPSSDEVESVALYNYYNYDEPYVEEDAVIEQAIEEHKKLIDKSKIYTVKPRSKGYHTRIHVKYKLKNGKEIKRAYWVDETEKYEIMGRLYGIDEYRLSLEGLVSEKPEDVYRVNLYSNDGKNVIITSPEEIKGLHEALSKDLMTLPYDQIYTDFSSASLSFEINRPGTTRKISELPYTEPYTEIINKRIEYAEASINTNFKNTNKWLNENGYTECSYYAGIHGTVYIAEHKALVQAGYNYTHLTGPAKMLKEKDLAGQHCVYLSEDAKQAFEEYLKSNYISHTPGEKEYEIIHSQQEGGYEFLIAFNEDELNEILEQIFE